MGDRYMRVLFWNTHKNKQINPVLLDLIKENEITFVALAEYTASTDELLLLLRQQGIPMEKYISIGCDRVTVLGSIHKIEPGPQSSHSSIQIWNNRTILCCVHLQSKAYPDHEERRKITIGHIIKEIRDLETALDTEDTMILGDFNVNPYDTACVGARNLHGIPIYEEAKRQSRVVAEEEFFMFYNPMWNLLGDFQKPYGTFYYNGGDSNNTFWNIYDQVIMRPSLRERFVDSSLKIVTQTGSISFLDDKGHPNREISDHLPIVFEMREC